MPFMSRLALKSKSPRVFQLDRLFYKRLQNIMYLGLYLIGITISKLVNDPLSLIFDR